MLKKINSPPLTRGLENPLLLFRDALEKTSGLKLLHCVLTMDENHDPKDKDGVILSCDPQQQKALFFTKLRPE